MQSVQYVVEFLSNHIVTSIPGGYVFVHVVRNQPSHIASVLTLYKTDVSEYHNVCRYS